MNDTDRTLIREILRAEDNLTTRKIRTREAEEELTKAEESVIEKEQSIADLRHNALERGIKLP